jgi:hypothetical protein
MNEADFIQRLQERAAQQERAIHSSPFPAFFLFVSNVFGRHPWRLIIPFAFILTIFFRLIFGSEYTTFILFIFRKL